MSAPIPGRSRISLCKLIAGGPDYVEVWAALETKFPKIAAGFTDDPAFPFVIRCADHNGQPRLAVLFRWSMAQDRWIYRVTAGC